jgi:hypothetical protein
MSVSSIKQARLLSLIGVSTMLRLDDNRPREEFAMKRSVLATTMIALLTARSASALITGGEGNEPVRDPGWPAGAAAVFNTSARVAYWVGPPFGGGQWHAECRGDAMALNAVLADFAKLDAKTKRIIVHDGVGHSFWLNPNREPAKEEAARIDWVFMVWQPTNWQRLRELPAELDPIGARDLGGTPPTQIDVYVGGNIRWEDVVLPPEIEVVDERLQAHGFSITDGTVLEGHVFDLATKQPIAAQIELQFIEPQTTGGYRYTQVASTTADGKGHWVLKNAPQGRHRIVATSDGYVPRVIGYGQFDDQSGWHSYPGRLSRPAHVSGRVIDRSGQPLAGVKVQLHDVATKIDGRYESPQEYNATTDAEGRFRIEQVPIGESRVWVRKPGYVRPRLGLAITTPKEDVELKMFRSSQLRITVDFSKTTRPEAYIVEIEPEGGSMVGSWGGSATIDANNQYSFTDVPPGRYVLKGRPNPGSEDQQTEPTLVVLLGGEDLEVKLVAK